MDEPKIVEATEVAEFPSPIIPVELDEYSLLVKMAQMLVKSGILMANPPAIITPTSKQDHAAKINGLINGAGALAIDWGVKKGYLTINPTEPLSVVKT